jgi:hypothetical protein
MKFLFFTLFVSVVLTVIMSAMLARVMMSELSILRDKRKRARHFDVDFIK